MESAFLISARRQFELYQSLGEKAMAQISEEGLFFKPSPESNSVCIIVQHLHGNMLSRWTDFLNSDGEKDWRQRDAEFEDLPMTRAQVLELWQKGWACLYSALDELNDEHLQQLIYIRNQGHTVMEAINRQLAHYPYHIGQMVYIAKLISDSKWQSLSIPKNKSSEYNADKFSQEKKREHFTDEFLKKKKD
jgi:hypothetical protein